MHIWLIMGFVIDYISRGTLSEWHGWFVDKFSNFRDIPHMDYKLETWSS